MTNTNDQILELLDSLKQAEASTDLDAGIKQHISQQLTLENYLKAELLLKNESARLGEAAVLNLKTGMQNTKDSFGTNFAQAYANFIHAQGLVSPEQSDDLIQR